MMKRRLAILLLGFIGFYYFIHITYTLPDLLNGHLRPPWLPTTWEKLRNNLIDIPFSSLFCVSSYLILNTFYPRKDYLYCLITLAASITLIFFINFWAAQLTSGEKFYLRFYFPNHLFFFSVYALYGVVYYFIRYSYDKELLEKELLVQSRQSELSFLRSQINPHFLFNSLNTIYSLVYHQSDKALSTIAGLSELLRYTLYDTTEKVLLEKEVIYIEKYIELQKLRFEDPIHVVLEVMGDVSNVYISPLLFIPFVENAFKHGRFTGETDGLEILLKSNTGKIRFECSNKVGKQQKDVSGGIGTENVKKRLRLLYPGKHTLDIKQNPDQFVVKLDLFYE